MQLFLIAEFILGIMVGLAFCATNAERQMLLPWRLLRSLSPDDATASGTAHRI
jgi:hypothetical protein